MDKRAVTRCTKRTRLHSFNEGGVISTQSSTTCRISSKRMFFRVHPFELLGWISSISLILRGFSVVPKLNTASVQLGNLFFRPVELIFLQGQGLLLV